MDIGAVALGLKTAGATIRAVDRDGTVNPYPNFPHSVSVPAFVIVQIEATVTGYCAEQLRVTCGLLTGRTDDGAAAAALYKYAAISGPHSVLNALEADPTLGGVCNDVTVITRRVPRVFPLGSTEYWAVEVVAEIDGEGETG